MFFSGASALTVTPLRHGSTIISVCMLIKIGGNEMLNYTVLGWSVPLFFAKDSPKCLWYGREKKKCVRFSSVVGVHSASTYTSDMIF